MDETINENVRWMPFGALALVLIVVTGFWKMEKMREIPPPPMDERQAQAAQRQSGGSMTKQEKVKVDMAGKPAPGFTLPALGGGDVSLMDYRGKIVFLNIWATWCPPCREEMPSMQKLYERFKGKDFEMVTISIDQDTSLVAPFMKELGLNFTVLFDPKEEVSSLYKITGVPETFIIDKNGVIMHHLVGPGDWSSDGLISAFEGLVKRAPGL